MSRILQEFRARGEDLCAEEIARAVEDDPAAVEAKLEELTRMGYLTQIGGDDVCEVCRERTTCALLPLRRRTYQLGAAPQGKWPMAERECT